MPATSMAGLGAFAKRIVDDGLDVSGTSAAFDAATETVIDLLGAARQIHGGVADRTADIVIAEDIAGTDNHDNASLVGVAAPSILKTLTGCKRKSLDF